MWAVWLTSRSFNLSHIQSAKVKVAEKDIDRLYEAADLFFDYADSIGLFFSMTEKKAKRLLKADNRHLSALLSSDDSVNAKTNQATEAVFEKFRSIHKSEFLLLSLGFEDVAKEVIRYREDTIAFRKAIFKVAKAKGSEDLTDLDKNFVEEIIKMRQHFLTRRDECLNLIASHKQHLQSLDTKK